MYIDNSCSECSYFDRYNDICRNKHAFSVKVSNNFLISFIENGELKNILIEDGLIDDLKEGIIKTVKCNVPRLSNKAINLIKNESDDIFLRFIDAIESKMLNLLNNNKNLGELEIKKPFEFNCSEFI